LAESHQTLVLKTGSASRVALEVDGQLKTARDIAVACLLGADEFGFGTIALVALGCVMMRVCHLNTCPVGIATQDPELRKKFAGRPEHVTRLMTFIAEDLRRIMARLGFHHRRHGGAHRSARHPARRRSLEGQGPGFFGPAGPAEVPDMLADVCTVSHRTTGWRSLWTTDSSCQCKDAIETGTPVVIRTAIRNLHRTVGTQISHEIARRHGEEGLPDDTIVIHADGSAGQSFFAFAAAGLTAHVTGDANDYFGKGLSGARLTLRPSEKAVFTPEANVIVGNVALYGRPPARLSSGASPESGSASETAAPRPWWRASATTAAST
jgi:hypothetical protein